MRRAAALLGALALSCGDASAHEPCGPTPVEGLYCLPAATWETVQLDADAPWEHSDHPACGVRPLRWGEQEGVAQYNEGLVHYYVDDGEVKWTRLVEGGVTSWMSGVRDGHHGLYYFELDGSLHWRWPDPDSSLGWSDETLTISSDASVFLGNDSQLITPDLDGDGESELCGLRDSATGCVRIEPEGATVLIGEVMWLQEEGWFLESGRFTTADHDQAIIVNFGDQSAPPLAQLVAPPQDEAPVLRGDLVADIRGDARVEEIFWNGDQVGIGPAPNLEGEIDYVDVPPMTVLHRASFFSLHHFTANLDGLGAEELLMLHPETTVVSGEAMSSYTHRFNVFPRGESLVAAGNFDGRGVYDDIAYVIIADQPLAGTLTIPCSLHFALAPN